MFEFFSEFWAQVVAVWEMAFWGQGALRTLAAVLIMILAYALRRFLAKIFASQLRRLTKKTKTEFDDLVIDALEEPLSLAPIALGIFGAVRVLNLTPDAESIGDQITQSLIAVVIFWALVRLVDPLAMFMTRGRSAMMATLLDWIRQALKIFFGFAGAAAVLQVWGIPVLPILASFSLLSVAIALGAQDLFKNLIAGATIIFEKRFNPGDWIHVDGVVEGTVEQINFRSTRVRRFDKAPVYVPNARLADTAVTNFSRMTHRRIYWHVGLEYRTSIEQLRAIRQEIEDYVTGSEHFASPFEASTFVRIDRFSDSSIDLMLYCFTKTTVWGEWLKVKEDLACKIIEIVQGAGAGFSFPSQSIYIEKAPGPNAAPANPESFDPDRYRQTAEA